MYFCMPFTWEQINSKWLLELPNQYSSKETIQAFNMVEEVLGTDFYEKYNYFRGQYFIKLVLDLATIFKEQKKGKAILPKNGEIFRNIKNNQVMKSDNILWLIAEFLKNNYIVESEPKLIIDKVMKRPDLRILHEDDWIYLEETQYDISAKHKELLYILNEISKILKQIKRNISVIVIKSDVINEDNIETVKELVKNQCSVAEQPQIRNIEGLVQVLTYEKNKNKPKEAEVRPALCQATLVGGEGYERHLDVRVPFVDRRITNILVKREQLSSSNPNLIIADLSMAGDIEEIYRRVNEVLSKQDYQKVSAVLLLQKHFYIKKIELDYKMIINKKSTFNLPDKFLQHITNYFDNNSTLLTR